MSPDQQNSVAPRTWAGPTKFDLANRWEIRWSRIIPLLGHTAAAWVFAVSWCSRLLWWMSVVWNPARHFLCRTWRFRRTMISSKNKNRVVLPSRPEPPSMDQILEDIQRAASDDPVFSILDQKEPGEQEELCSFMVMKQSSSIITVPSYWYTPALVVTQHAESAGCPRCFQAGSDVLWLCCAPRTGPMCWQRGGAALPTVSEVSDPEWATGGGPGRSSAAEGGATSSRGGVTERGGPGQRSNSVKLSSRCEMTVSWPPTSMFQQSMVSGDVNKWLFLFVVFGSFICDVQPLMTNQSDRLLSNLPRLFFSLFVPEKVKTTWKWQNNKILLQTNNLYFCLIFVNIFKK